MTEAACSSIDDAISSDEAVVCRDTAVISSIILTPNGKTLKFCRIQGFHMGNNTIYVVSKRFSVMLQLSFHQIL